MLWSLTEGIGIMPTISLVLMAIGGIGIICSVVAFLYGLLALEEEWPFDRFIIGSLIIGQAIFNAGIVYWLLAQ